MHKNFQQIPMRKLSANISTCRFQHSGVSARPRRLVTLIGLPPRPAIPCIVVRAVCCSVSFPNRMNPNPLLPPASSSTTKTRRKLGRTRGLGSGGGSHRSQHYLNILIIQNFHLKTLMPCATVEKARSGG